MATRSITKNIAGSNLCWQIGERVRLAREAKSWSQQLLADHADISKVHLIAIEKGRTEVGLLVLERLAKALGLRLVDLIA